MEPVYFEDLVEGHVDESSEVIADRDDMVAFAERIDPYRIHVDEQFAATTPFDGLVASFGYTVSLYCRMIHDIELYRAIESTMLGALEWRVTFRGPICHREREVRGVLRRWTLLTHPTVSPYVHANSTRACRSTGGDVGVELAATRSMRVRSVLTADVHIADLVEAGSVRRVHRSPFLKKRLMSTVFDEVEGQVFGGAASAV